MRAIRVAFRSRIALALKVVQDAHATDAHGAYLLPLEEREVITNACYMRMFIAFEEFLEASFLHFAMGRMSTNRWRPAKYVKPATEDHANRMLIGTQRFVDWSTPDVVRKLANLYFHGGEPFNTPLLAAHQHLLDMKTVRNATAHVSRTTQASLDALQSRWTGVPTVGTTAYAMLLSNQVGTRDSFMTMSESTLGAIVSGIADRI